MKHLKPLALSTLSILVFCGILKVSSAEATMHMPKSVKEATRHCEKEVQKHCQEHLCKRHCPMMSSASLKEKCEKECGNPEASCKVRLSGGRDKVDKLMSPSDANATTVKQVNEMFVQCVAEHRDPEGKKTGRRIFERELDHPGEGWMDVRTPSWTKATGESSGREISKHDIKTGGHRARDGY